MNKRRTRRREWWTQGARAVEVGKRLRLVPHWDRRTAGSDRIDLIIDPGPSFGAGDHPTTLMALELLEKAVERCRGGRETPTMLDIGTGTGVLAIAAKALGTGLTVGLDIDSAAIFSARRNGRLNAAHWQRSRSPHEPSFYVGDARSVRGRFDVVAVNLVAPILIREVNAIAPRVSRFLILSGIADPLKRQVADTYGGVGLKVVERAHMEGWNAMLWQVKE